MAPRRAFVFHALTTWGWPVGLGAGMAACAPMAVRSRFSEIERRVGGRLGVAAVDVATGGRLVWRDDERFPMCSTFKWVLAAQVLSRVDRGDERLDRPVRFGEADLLDYAPVTRRQLRDGAMSISELCAAAVRFSDNTAANLLLEAVGGPGDFTAYLRHLDDPVTRLDRVEPHLNSAEPGDVRDTTTPAAMLGLLRRVLLGSELSAGSRDRLIGWLVASRTGAAKLRAGFPAAWRVGDKTGMGENGATCDVAIAWPARASPILVAAYLTESRAQVTARNGALADVGRVVADWAGA